MGVEAKIGVENPPKSSILIGVSLIDHPFWGVFPLFLVQYLYGHIRFPQIQRAFGVLAKSSVEAWLA